MADPATYWESYRAEHRYRLTAQVDWAMVKTVAEVGACCAPNARLLLESYPHLKFTLIDRDASAMQYGRERLTPKPRCFVRDVTVPGWWDGIAKHDVAMSCWLLSELDFEQIPTAARGIDALGRELAIMEPDRALTLAEPYFPPGTGRRVRAYYQVHCSLKGAPGMNAEEVFKIVDKKTGTATESPLCAEHWRRVHYDETVTVSSVNRIDPIECPECQKGA
jgi:hypothetical protein